LIRITLNTFHCVGAVRVFSLIANNASPELLNRCWLGHGLGAFSAGSGVHREGWGSIVLSLCHLHSLRWIRPMTQPASETQDQARQTFQPLQTQIVCKPRDELL